MKYNTPRFWKMYFQSRSEHYTLNYPAHDINITSFINTNTG